MEDPRRLEQLQARARVRGAVAKLGRSEIETSAQVTAFEVSSDKRRNGMLIVSRADAGWVIFDRNSRKRESWIASPICNSRIFPPRSSFAAPWKIRHVKASRDRDTMFLVR